MSWWIKLGCFLTGWNSQILKSCSEASFKQLKKYTAALIILIILWAFTGYCFAERYVGAPVWGCVITSVIFVVIVLQIERQIILTVGRNKWPSIFRIFIAFIMAILGSTIIDQIIFGEDIDRKMIEIVDRNVEEQLPMRLSVIDTKLADIQTEIDSLDKVNIALNEEIMKKPTINTVSTSTTYQRERQTDGTYKEVPQRTVSTSPVENPRIKQVETNNENLKRLRQQHEAYTAQKIDAESTLRKELASKSGFLEELNAMMEIILTRKIAMAFYIIVFLFLISLELFVVTSKIGDQKSDYELIVEHQLKSRKAGLEELGRQIT